MKIRKKEEEGIIPEEMMEEDKRVNNVKNVNLVNLVNLANIENIEDLVKIEEMMIGIPHTETTNQKEDMKKNQEEEIQKETTEIIRKTETPVTLVELALATTETDKIKTEELKDTLQEIMR